MTPTGPGRFHQETKMLAQLGGTARDVNNRRPMFFDPLPDALGGLGFHHLRPPGRSIDVAMPARLIAFAPDVELKRLQRGPFQHKPMTLQLLFKYVHSCDRREWPFTRSPSRSRS